MDFIRLCRIAERRFKMPSRIDRMNADANDLAAKIFEFYSTDIQNVVFDNNEFTLRFELKEIIDENISFLREISICFSEDYPDNTVIYGLNDPPGNNDFQSICATASKVFDIIVKNKRSNENGASAMDTSDLKSEDAEQDEEEDAHEDLYGLHDDEHFEVHQALKNDIEFCQGALENGDLCTFFHEHKSLETAHIVFRISFEGLDPHLAEAWGIDINQRICIQLVDVNVVHYRMTSKLIVDLPPEVKVFQESGTQKGTSLRQLQCVLKKCLDETWKVQDESAYGQLNILYEICDYAKRRLFTLCDFCVICDQKHELTAMSMPSVCCRDLCVFAFETLGVMGDIDVRICSQIEVIDLLLKMIRAATLSHRHDLILVPFPMIPDPVVKTELAIANKTEHYLKLVDVVKKIPCTLMLKEMNDKGQVYVDECRKIEPLLYPLIRWVTTSNRAYLLKLKDEDRLPFLNTPHQYLMMMDSPAKEAAFREAKKNNMGISTFAFHGSPFENWHSILRRGLINASNTALMTTGAAHGQGIYLSPHLNVSMGYAHSRHGVTYGIDTARPYCAEKGILHDCTEGGRFLGSQSVFSCIALCEVIPTSALTHHANIWVMKNAELVCTRFLLVYDGSYVQSTNVDCSDANTLASIKQAVEKFCKT